MQFKLHTAPCVLTGLSFCGHLFHKASGRQVSPLPLLLPPPDVSASLGHHGQKMALNRTTSARLKTKLKTLLIDTKDLSMTSQWQTHSGWQENIHYFIVTHWTLEVALTGSSQSLSSTRSALYVSSGWWRLECETVLCGHLSDSQLALQQTPVGCGRLQAY